MAKDLTVNKGGRPPIFSDPEEMAQAIDEYFAECDNRIKEIHTKEGDAVGVTVPEPYTMSGLAYAIGMDRDTLLAYSTKDKFSGTVKRAKNKVAPAWF